MKKYKPTFRPCALSPSSPSPQLRNALNEHDVATITLLSNKTPGFESLPIYLSDYDDLEYRLNPSTPPFSSSTSLTEIGPSFELEHLVEPKGGKREQSDGLSIAQRERQESLPTSTKKLNRLLGSQKVGKFELKETELREKFVRGSGNGGQAINKLSTCVDLMHIPTGLRVQAQPTRSLQTNREIARKLMAEKLATMDKESSLPSRAEILTAKRKLKKTRAVRRSKKKYAFEDRDEESTQGLVEGTQETRAESEEEVDNHGTTGRNEGESVKG
ncbi:Mitochondrial polypeptide chain release factor [Phaffia rhodozyma]|uniref:Mitochondrial polypeptide chain release factor n=1 Tax=Phaffia rhodozyma TaxID=264483 RepID=A0A0F7SI94_PHARH|nr:Mitochondrial polypeptide chain release factor [Phaffia rhodozyma]